MTHKPRAMTNQPSTVDWLNGGSSLFASYKGCNLDEYVCLINCPMEDKEYRKVYTVEALGNVIEGNAVRYLNVTSEEMKAASASSIKDNHPVWFGCDVGKHFDRKIGVMDIDLFDFNSFYQSKFSMDKADRLQYGNEFYFFKSK